MTKSLSKAIALATLVGVSASAHAVNVNPDGLGQVLLYPLYTTEQGNDTNISITNTTGFVKAVKVRFLEGQNSQEVLDFNLYLSPYDQWSGAITQTEKGAKLVTFDRSCTAPAIPAGGVQFRDYQYKDDGGEKSLARSRVGHVEIIEMGDINPEFTLPNSGTPGINLAGLAIHNPELSGAAGTNADCSALRAQFSGSGIWAGSDMQTGFLGESAGGLYGHGAVLNVEKSTQISYDATAIDNFKAAGTTLHAKTGLTFPGLNDGKNSTATLKNGEVLEFAESIDAVSAVLMKHNISNDYVLDEGRLSETNWVITFPTKRLHVYETDENAPFVNKWAKGQSCHEVGLRNWDNEEFAGTPADLDFSPSLPGESAALCYETNILTFNKSKMLGGEFVSYDVSLDQPDFQFGWMDIDFTETAPIVGLNIDDEEVNVTGLPAIGFSAVTISNNIAANGVMNNYGSSTSHKAKTSFDKMK